MPFLDILKKNTNKIIGTRSYSGDKKIIDVLGNICTVIYTKNKIGNVIKHIPGHGSSKLDSHKKLPKVHNDIKNLYTSDFLRFSNSRAQFAMTAHILYTKLDSKNVVTHSKYIIKKIIRQKLKFKGILISDDISMKALKYDIFTNAKKSLEAGCNLVLYCGGNYVISEKLLRGLPFIDTFTVKKTSEFYKFLS